MDRPFRSSWVSLGRVIERSRARHLWRFQPLAPRLVRKPRRPSGTGALRLGGPLVGRVLRLDLLAADRGDGVVGGDRRLAHADRDQGDLPGIAGDVARRVDAGKVRLAARRVDLDLPLALELESPVGDRAQVRVKAEQRDQGVALDLLGLAALGVLDRDRADVPVTVNGADLVGGQDSDPAIRLELLRLVHRRLERSELVPAMHEGDRMLGRVLESQRPVERTVAAADDDTRAVAEDVLLADEVVQPLALPGVDVLDAELPRLERSVAGRDDQRAAQVRPPLVRRDREQLLAVLAQALERLNLLAEQDLRLVLEPLLRAELDERLTLDLRMAGDVVDVLLRIDRRDLAADLLEAFDDANRGIAMPRVIRGREP